MSVRFLACGDGGLTIEFGDRIERKLSQSIMALRHIVDDAEIAGVIETVPTYRSLLIHYDPLILSSDDLISAVQPLVSRLEAGDLSGGRCFTLPVCFADEFATDMGGVADFARLTAREVEGRLTGLDHYVYMLGFAPGLPYMGDLPEELAIPRKTTPVKNVAAGSVLVATGLTIIYPTKNPTGWHVVGRCPVPIFDLSKDDPVLLSPGDRVRFRSVGMAEYTEIEQAAAEGSFGPLLGEAL